MLTHTTTMACCFHRILGRHRDGWIGKFSPSLCESGYDWTYQPETEAFNRIPSTAVLQTCWDYRSNGKHEPISHRIWKTSSLAVSLIQSKFRLICNIPGTVPVLPSIPVISTKHTSTVELPMHAPSPQMWVRKTDLVYTKLGVQKKASNKLNVNL